MTRLIERKDDYLSTFRNLEDRFEHMFHDLWHKPFHHEDKPAPFAISVFEGMPKLDMVDREKEIFVEAELPGISKKDIDVSISNNQLVIKARSSHEEKQEKGDFLKREISRSEVYRSLVLPAEVDEDKVRSSFKNGVLKLTIPKKKEAQRKQIKVE